MEQIQRNFVAMFEAKKAEPERLQSLILKCESNRDMVDAPMWKWYIDVTVTEKINELKEG